MIDWQKVVGRSTGGKIPIDQLNLYVPRPGHSQNHVLPYQYDDWGFIEGVKAGAMDPHLVKFELSCAACTVKVTAVQPRSLVQPDIKWLCDNCIDDKGFAWGSTVLAHQMSEYQLVKQYPDDTLLRRLDKSPNHRDPLHDPFDPDSNRRKII